MVENEPALRGQADKAGVPLRTSRRYSRLINAVAATVPAGQLGTIRALPGVKAVYPDLPMKATASGGRRVPEVRSASMSCSRLPPSTYSVER